MPKYTVVLSGNYCVTAVVEANNAEEAEDAAFQEVRVTAYCGNGGSDKLIGVDGQNMSIDDSDYLELVSIEKVK